MKPEVYAWENFIVILMEHESDMNLRGFFQQELSWIEKRILDYKRMQILDAAIHGKILFAKPYTTAVNKFNPFKHLPSLFKTLSLTAIVNSKHYVQKQKFSKKLQMNTIRTPFIL